MRAMAPERDIRCSSALWTRPGLARWSARLAAIAMALPALELLADAAARIAGLVRGRPSFPAGTHDAVLFLVAAILAAVSVGLRTLGWPRLAHAALRVDATGVHLRAAHASASIAFDAIHQGLIAYAEHGAALVLDLSDDRRVTIAVDERDAAEILAALRLEPQAKRVTMRIGSPTLPLVLGGLGIGLGPLFLMLSWAVIPTQWMSAADGAHIPLLLGFGIGVALLLARLAAPAELTIGTDGIHVRRRLRGQFIAYGRLASSGLSGKTLVFSVRPVTGDPARVGWIHLEGATFDQVLVAHGRIEAARHAPPGREGSEALEALDPQGKTVEAWMAELRELADPRRATYRRATLGAESLLDVLDQPDADIGSRIGAAVALRLGDHEGAAKRILLAAASVANDEARAALESLAAEEALGAETVAAALRGVAAQTTATTREARSALG
jgi:hypothetical protein